MMAEKKKLETRPEPEPETLTPSVHVINLSASFPS